MADTSFLDLVADPEQLPKLAAGIEHALEKSFTGDVVMRPVRTQHEIRRRFQICCEGIRIMRRDLKWSVSRIVDELPAFLRCQLDGGTWVPDDRRAWTAPADGVVLDEDDADEDVADPVADLS